MTESHFYSANASFCRKWLSDNIFYERARLKMYLGLNTLLMWYLISAFTCYRQT